MLETGEAKHWAEWKQYRGLEPWGDDWERSSMIAARTINSIADIAHAFCGEAEHEIKPIEDDAFVPKWRKQEPDLELEAQLEAIEQIDGFGV